MIYCLINIYYRFIGPTETQLEVRENTADLEVKLEKKIRAILYAMYKNTEIFELLTQAECIWLIVKIMTVSKFLPSQKSIFFATSETSTAI